MHQPACRPITKPGFHSPPAITLRGENQSSSVCPEDTERETHIYYTWCMWPCRMNWPRQIGHILLRHRPVSEGSQLRRVSKITAPPPQLPSPENGHKALWKMLPIRMALQASHLLMTPWAGLWGQGKHGWTWSCPTTEVVFWCATADDARSLQTESVDAYADLHLECLKVVSQCLMLQIVEHIYIQLWRQNCGLATTHHCNREKIHWWLFPGCSLIVQPLIHTQYIILADE